MGFQKSASACDLRRSAFHAAGMITDVSLGLLYLIVDRSGFLSWLILLRRAMSSKDIELLVLRRALGRSPLCGRCAAPVSVGWWLGCGGGG